MKSTTVQRSVIYFSQKLLRVPDDARGYHVQWLPRRDSLQGGVIIAGLAQSVRQQSHWAFPYSRYPDKGGRGGSC